MVRHYIFIRRDLPLGVALAQAVHAAGESSTHYAGAYDSTLYRTHLPAHTVAVVLEAEDELHLLEIQKMLQVNSVKHVSVVETDQPYCQQLMAIGLVPTSSDEVVKLLKPFKLLRKLEEASAVHF